MSKPTILRATLCINCLWCQMTVHYRSGAVRIYRHRNNAAATADAWLPATVRNFMGAPDTRIRYREGKACDGIITWRGWTYSAPHIVVD